MPAPALSEQTVKRLPIPPKGNKVHFFSGATLQGKKAPAGFGVRVTAGGTKAFVLFHRVDGRKYLETLGRWDENEQGGTLTVRDAIIAADKRMKAIAKGTAEDHRPERTRRLQDGDRPEGRTVADVFDMFIERYAKKEAKLRTAGEIEAQLNRLAKPEIGNLGIYEIRRSHIVDMLDEIADENGDRMADLILAYVRKSFTWFALRDDQFNSPIVKGMARTKPGERKRKRILADDEIRDLWAALDTVQPACVGPFVRSLLLCATRRNESADMSTAELDGDVWTIPGERYKNKLDHVIPLSSTAAALFRTQAPKKASKNAHFVFSTTDGAKPISGFSKIKREIDKALDEIRTKAGRTPMHPWTFHDLRRTARSLMSRAKVPADHAERALGHIMGGVRGTYDRHEYFDEKRAAFEALAGLVGLILNPQPNVEQLATRRGKA